MGRMMLIFAFVLLAFGAANAAFVAHFPQGTGMLYPDNLVDAQALADGSYSYPGHIGRYDVKVGTAEDGIFVSVEGAEESQSMLAYEVSYLVETGALATTCGTTGLLALKNEREPVCIGTQWVSCSIVASCVPRAGGQLSAVEDRSFRLPPSITAKALPSAPSSGAEAAGALSPQPMMAQIAQESAAGTTDNGAGQSAAQEQAAPQAGIGAQQALPLIAGFLAVVIVSYLILQQRQEAVQLEISPQEERLMQNETRAGIMEQLEGADRIPTDLSTKLGKSKATVVEHLETLVEAGFVEKLATPGKKFVYYRLTQKGKRMLLKIAG